MPQSRKYETRWLLLVGRPSILLNKLTQDTLIQKCLRIWEETKSLCLFDTRKPQKSC